MYRLTRPKEAETHLDQEGSWAISYGDMVTLLLSFFIIFFSIQTPEKVRKLINDSLITSLAGLSQTTQQPSHSQTNQKTTGSLQAVQPQAMHALALAQDKGKISLEKIGERVVISFPNSSFFASGETDLTQDGRENLRRFVAKYLPYAGKNTLHILGYSDKRPVPKGRRYRDNLELSVLRAVAAQRELEQMGIPIDRTRLAGFGISQSMPELTPNVAQDLQLSLARKIVLIIEPDGESK